jgi:hypothetical protein
MIALRKLELKQGPRPSSFASRPLCDRLLFASELARLSRRRRVAFESEQPSQLPRAFFGRPRPSVLVS